MLLPSERLAPSTATDFVTDVAEYLQRTPRQLAVPLLLRRAGVGSVRCHLPAAVVSRNRARSRRCSRATGARYSSRCHGRSTSPSWGVATARSSQCCVENGGERFRRVHLIDISPAALDVARVRGWRCSRRYRSPRFRARTSKGCRGSRRIAGHGAWLVLFLGSNIGNFDPPAARELLRQIRASLTKATPCCSGRDLVKRRTGPSARVRRSAAGDRGVQPQPAAADQ